MGRSASASDWLAESRPRSPYELTDGSRVAVIGGGPAGSFFSYFLLDMAERAGRRVDVDMYEPRDFWGVGPASCNMCGGIISETLVQNLAAEGIVLPDTIVQRGIDSYVLHMDVGRTRIDTPLDEKRIGAVHRASGPRDLKEIKFGSFDGFLQTLALKKGANLVRDRVAGVAWDDGRPVLKAKDGGEATYDLVVVAAGVNSATLKMFDGADLSYEAPATTKTFLREYLLGADVIEEHLGSSMHVFLLDIPRLEFAAIIPKGDYVSMALLGEDIDKKLLEEFLASPQVQACMPPGWESAANSCQCAPKISVKGAPRPYGDRVVFVGDSGVTRLYKDGIGAAYRTAKIAASTAMFEGVSAEAFESHYLPACRRIESDNAIGKFMFRFTEVIRRYPFARRAVLRMVRYEQARRERPRRMSTVLWDLFTGSSSYRDILKRTLSPAFLGRLGWDVARSVVPPRGANRPEEDA